MCQASSSGFRVYIGFRACRKLPRRTPALLVGCESLRPTSLGSNHDPARTSPFKIWSLAGCVFDPHVNLCEGLDQERAGEVKAVW